MAKKLIVARGKGYDYNYNVYLYPAGTKLDFRKDYMNAKAGSWSPRGTVDASQHMDYTTFKKLTGKQVKPGTTITIEVK